MQPKTFIKSLHTLSKLSDVDDTSTSDKMGALPENPQSLVLNIYIFKSWLTYIIS